VAAVLVVDTLAAVMLAVDTVPMVAEAVVAAVADCSMVACSADVAVAAAVAVAATSH
jgi:hypothetical protein